MANSCGKLISNVLHRHNRSTVACLCSIICFTIRYCSPLYDSSLLMRQLYIGSPELLVSHHVPIRYLRFLTHTVLQEYEAPCGYMMTDEQLWLAYVEL